MLNEVKHLACEGHLPIDAQILRFAQDDRGLQVFTTIWE